MEKTEIIRINTEHPLFKDIFELRDLVLRQPLGLSLYEEDTSGDREDEIFVLKQEEKPIACLMLKPVENGVYKLRQMAVIEEYQGKGWGKLLVETAEKWLKEEKNTSVVRLHARAYATTFYKKLGYSISGEPFSEVGIPHFFMEKGL